MWYAKHSWRETSAWICQIWPREALFHCLTWWERMTSDGWRQGLSPSITSSPTQHSCGSSLAVESALVSAPQLWDTTITAIIWVRKLTEPFNECESDSESSLIIVFSSLEIHRHPGQPRFLACMTAQDKEKQLKVTVSFLPVRASCGFDPKTPRQWELGPVTDRGLAGDSISTTCSP